MKKLIVLLMILISVEGWGQNTDFVFTLQFEKVEINNSQVNYCNFVMILEGIGLNDNNVSVTISGFADRLLATNTEVFSYTTGTNIQGTLFKSFNRLTIGISDGNCYAYCAPVPISGVCMENKISVQSSCSNNSVKATVLLTYKPKQKVELLSCKDHNNNVISVGDDFHFINDKNITLEVSNSGIIGRWEFRSDNILRQMWTTNPATSYTGDNVFGTENFLQIIKEKTPIYVKFILGSDGAKCHSDEIVLHPTLSAPTILSIETIPPSCDDANDGKAIIHFSRAVYENELLQILIEGLSVDENNIRVVPPGVSTYTITGLSAGGEQIVLDGKYPYNPDD